MSKIFLAALLTTFTGFTLLSGGGCARTEEDEATRPASADPAERVGRVSSALADDAGDGGTVKRGQIVISQVFGGGGNSGSPFEQDYVELFNRSQAAVSLEGLSIQIASASGTFTDVVALTGSIPAGGYFLIGLESGITGEPIPTPDLEANEDITQTDGKVALVNNTAPLGCGGATRCAKDKLLDLVGYGASSDFEGNDKAPALGSDKAALRKNNGCTDADDNSKDFTSGAPAPRNSATAVALCPPTTGSGTDAGAPPPPVVDPPLGEEAPYDGGARRDAGGKAGGSGSDDSSCSLGWSPDAGTSSTAFGLICGVVIVASMRRRRSSKR